MCSSDLSHMHAIAENAQQVMHAELEIAGTRVNMCDASSDIVSGNMYRFNIFFDTVDEVVDAYNQLSAGGHIITALGPQFWTEMYGDVEDPYGVLWQLMAK